MRKFLIGLVAVTATAAVAAILVMRTPLLISDIRTEPLGDRSAGRKVLEASQRAHGGLDAWKARSWVELEVSGHVPFPPARWAFGVPAHTEVRLRFDPQVVGLATLTVDDGEPIAIDTRKERDGLGLLADSLRHLWEFPFAMDTADVVAGLASVDGHDRVFLSWGTDAPQMTVDQYILWSDGTHRTVRFDSTGRAITPFTKAVVVFEDHRRVEGFEVPGRVKVTRAGQEGAVVHEWTLKGIRLGPDRRKLAETP